MRFDLLKFATDLAIFFVPFLFSLCFHEYAHGWVARLRGDRTAEKAGRLTMNPLAHMDMMGTVILPIMSILLSLPIFFGWAKPVPLNTRNLKNPRTDMFWVALAGPASNFLLALIGAFIMTLTPLLLKDGRYVGGLLELEKAFIVVNLFLAFFNFLPLHPLDGGKIVSRFLPASLSYKLEQNQHISGIILMLLVISGGVRFIAIPVQWAYYLLQSLAQGILT
jgi:Zn-dependent protease